jgi:hypothetical protein
MAAGNAKPIVPNPPEVTLLLKIEFRITTSKHLVLPIRNHNRITFRMLVDHFDSFTHEILPSSVSTPH